jgi:hypothetical protein
MNTSSNTSSTPNTSTPTNINANSFMSPSNFSLYMIGVGILVTLITTFLETNKYTLKGTMIGYSVITTGYLILLATIINGIKGNTFTVLEIVKTVTPFILIVGTIVFLTYNIGKYYNNISKGRISKNYNTFSIIFMLLTLLEAVILYRTKTSLQFKRTSTIPTILYWSLILVGVINFIVVGIISIDLAYFNTDG